MNFSEKRILVTGGTWGIGRAIALGLLDRGIGGLVVAAEETEPNGWEEFESKGASYLHADLGTETEPGELVRRSHELMGGLDGLIHCAGVYLEGNPGDRNAVQIWNETVNIKARGGYLLATEFAKVATDGASFVGITSINAEQSEPDHLAYDPACAALGGVIRAFAVHCAPRLRFNALAPGLIHTRLTEEVAASAEMSDHAAKNIPLQKLGRPEDCVGAALFLLSDDASYITGETIFVDGGIHANQMSREK